MVRKKGLFFLSVFAVLIFVLSWLFTNSWLESQLEDMGSAVNGARVEIDNLDFSITGAHLKWQRLQVADAAHPMKNKFETGPCRMDFEFWPLLSGKIIISAFTIAHLRTNTPRESDGSLTDTAKEALAEKNLVQKGVSQMGGLAAREFGKIRKQANTDSLLKAAGLTSPGKMDSLYARLDSLSSVWEKRSAAANPLPRIKAIEKQIAAIDTKSLNDINKLTKALKQTAKAKKSIDKLNSEIKTLKKEFDADFTSVTAGLTQVDDWIKSDYKRAESLLQMPDFSAGNVGRMILGPMLTERFTEYLGYLQTARKYARKYQSTAPKEENPPRLKGQDIYFYSPNARPDFWIQKIHLSGSTADSLRLQGTVRNMVSNQKQIGRPTLFKIGGENKNGVSLNLEGTFNYLHETPQEAIRLNYSGFSLKGSSSLFPGKITRGIGTIKSTLKINGSTLKGRLDFVARKVTFAGDNQGKSEMQRLLIKSIQDAKRITASAAIDGTLQSPDFHIRTNLDQLLTNQLKERFGSEIKKQRAKIEVYIGRQTASKRKKLEAFAKARGLNLKATLSNYDDAVQAQRKKLDGLKKQLQKKLTKQKNKLGKDATKKLKNLF